MAKLVVHHDKIDAAEARQLIELCPFSAISYENGKVVVGAGCRMCKICVNKGPAGAVTFQQDAAPTSIDNSDWRGIAVYAEQRAGRLHNVVLELVGKARELAAVCGHPVYALLIGSNTAEAASRLLRYGVDKVFVYENPVFDHFLMDPYITAFDDFIEAVRPSSILVGATNTGRSLAPRIAARRRTGLTADCTVLQMKENSDLVQIRPAFGGNIMAQIVTPKHRPQFCTARYKVFSAPQPVAMPTGVVEHRTLSGSQLESRTQILEIAEKPSYVDISEARILVAAGRGIKTRNDLALVEELANILNAQTACTRPLIENGWFDARRQIGLSGRTVGAELIITIGISGAVQFCAGMQGCGCIIAVNQDEGAPIFDLAHYAVIGDLYEILPELIASCKEGLT